MILEAIAALPSFPSSKGTSQQQKSFALQSHVVLSELERAFGQAVSSKRMIAGTLQTDPRSGGVKRSSGVNVLPEVSETWTRVRDNSDGEVDWLVAGYVPGSKTDITVLASGPGGTAACAAALPDGEPVFGGCRMSTGRFQGFFYVPENTSSMKKGRASMHKNGVLNVLEGRDGEIDMKPGFTE